MIRFPYLPRFLFFFACLLVFFPISVTPVSSQNKDPNTIKIKDFYPPTVTLTPIIDKSQSTPTGMAENKNTFSYFSQRDPRWRTYNPATTGQLGICGCGETSVSMILTTLLANNYDGTDGNFNPKKMWDYFESLYPGRCGTSLLQHQNVFYQKGLTAKINAYDPTNPAGQNAILKNYLSAGYLIILYYGRSWTPIGHYVVLADIRGTDILVYDPYYLPGATQPVLIEEGAIINSYLIVK